MNQVIEFFNLSFLKKIDKYLLLNYPLIWNFKLPYVFFYMLILQSAVVSIILLYKVELYEVSKFYDYIGYLALIVLFPFILWIKKQSEYKISDKYGKVVFNGLNSFLLYLCCQFLLNSGLMIELAFKYQYKYDMSKDDNITAYNDYDYFTDSFSTGAKKLDITTIESIDYLPDEIKSRYNQTILDLSIVTKVKDIKQKNLERAQINYAFLSELHSDKGIYLDLTAVLWLTFLLILYRLVSLIDFLWGVSVFILLFLHFNSASALEVDRFLNFSFLQLIILFFLYVWLKNKVLIFLLFIYLIFIDLLFLVQKFEYFLLEINPILSLELVYLLVSFFMMLIFIYPIKHYLIKFMSEPKDL